MRNPWTTLICAVALALSACNPGNSSANANASEVAPEGAATRPAKASAAPPEDLFAFAAGAQFVAKPADNDYADGNYGPYNLIDESDSTDWSAHGGKPAVLVLELAERTKLTRVSFDTAGLNIDEKTVKSIRIAAAANSINANTAMNWNQYIYNSRVESARIYHEKAARLDAKDKGNYQAIQARLRTNPNAVDIANGGALNVVLNDLTDPKVFKNAVYYGGKIQLGGETIRDIPFQYASEGITTSVHQLTQGGAPAALKRDEFGPDRDKLKAIAAELRKEGEELGTPRPETIKRAKDQIMATRAKVEATFPQNSQERRDAEKYIKSLYGLASMLETPAVSVLLAGVEKRPEAHLGDLLGFMTSYNLRFGAAETARQKDIYRSLYASLSRLRDEVIPANGSTPPPIPPPAGVDAPGAVFGGMNYNHAEAAPPAPQPPR